MSIPHCCALSICICINCITYQYTKRRELFLPCGISNSQFHFGFSMRMRTTSSNRTSLNSQLILLMSSSSCFACANQHTSSNHVHSSRKESLWYRLEHFISLCFVYTACTVHTYAFSQFESSAECLSLRIFIFFFFFSLSGIK